MKTVAAFFAGTIVGAVLLYGLQPFPRVIWDGQINGSISNATFHCVGLLARHGAYVEVTGLITIEAGSVFGLCPGFMRPDYWLPGDGIITSAGSFTAIKPE